MINLHSRNIPHLSALRDALVVGFPIHFGVFALGIGYGVYMRSAGLGLGWTILMASTIFSGSMEFITVGLLGESFHPVYAFLLTLAVNGRYGFYSLSMLAPYRAVGWQRPFMIATLIDESFTLNHLSSARPDRPWYMFFVSLWLYLAWNSGALIGSLFGSLPLFRMEGFGFVMPALFLSIFVEQWLTEASHRASLLGLAVSLAALFVFGETFFMLPALLIAAAILSLLYFSPRKEVRP